MLLGQRFEIAPPPLAIDVAGGDLASGSATWTALPDLGETTVSAADSRRELDYMHARFFSPTTARFLSTDPVGGSPRSPQSWNRYAYVQGNPLKYTDPDGMLLKELFNSIKTWISGRWDAAFPPPQADPNDPNAQALADPDVGGNPNLLPRNQAGLVQQGLNEATSSILAGAVTGAVVVGSDLAARGITDKMFEAVADGPLAGALRQLFRNSDRLPGGTAGAIRYELRTGELVGGRSHILKGTERARQLERLLKNESLNSQDRRVAQAVLDDLRGAMRGE